MSLSTPLTYTLKAASTVYYNQDQEKEERSGLKEQQRDKWQAQQKLAYTVICYQGNPKRPVYTQIATVIDVGSLGNGHTAVTTKAGFHGSHVCSAENHSTRN